MALSLGLCCSVKGLIKLTEIFNDARHIDFSVERQVSLEDVRLPPASADIAHPEFKEGDEVEVRSFEYLSEKNFRSFHPSCPETCKLTQITYFNCHQSLFSFTRSAIN